MDRKSADEVERCNSAPVIKWIELHPGILGSPLLPGNSFKPIPLTPEVDRILPVETGSLRRPGSLRLRRHSSLTRGILQRVRTNSEADERPGEAKINTSISLNSSTEHLHLSPNPGISPNPAFFRPIGSPNSVFDSPGSASPESRCEYPLRSRQQPGRQMFKPVNTRKRSARSSMDTDDGHSVQSNAIKRIKLDLDWSDDRTVSNDSGTVEDIDGRPRRLDCLPDSASTQTQPSLPYDWWHNHGANFHDRIRRMSSESSISIDSITKEFNQSKDSK